MTPCELWQKVVQTPDEPGLIAEEQYEELGRHVNGCDTCYLLVEERENKDLLDPENLDAWPLWVKVLLAAGNEIPPEELEMMNAMRRENERAEQAVRQAVSSFIASNMQLEPSRYGLSADLDPLRLWYAWQGIMMLTSRFCRIKFDGMELRSLAFDEDGGLVLNDGEQRIPVRNVVTEIRNMNDGQLAQDESSRVALWLRDAVNANPKLVAVDLKDRENPLDLWKVEKK